ncbi:hypothetical protein [Luteimonas fraxinea]|uniref:Uncharacterized protein n=1 Tax=Luteimonas fraxinea TaxID=2901869 RepID=A0ABS8U9M7_9GAMM|nr:hypothetical protein [Luteimonas fraxinea]MCD9096186.1 hypothetical protein [Luteimonas fraxinea]
MSVYWVTFRLDNGIVGGKDYSTRYAALVEAVKGHRSSNWWFEPTSFWLFDSASTRAQIAASIKAAIAPTHDLALIGSMESVGATLVGKAEKLTDLKNLVPTLQTA